MRFDVGLPYQCADKSRDESLIVCFDGFIKNTTEGIIRTMLRDMDDWVELYPGLSDFNEMTMEELYDNTMLFRPHELLSGLSQGKRSEEDILKDIEKISPNVFLENSKLTSFEYALYTILQSPTTKVCYIYKEGPYYPNELQYIYKAYGPLMRKVHVIENTNLVDLFDGVKSTTVFLTDPAFVFDYVENHVSEEKSDGVMFVILNSVKTVEMLEDEDNFQYTEEFQSKMEETNHEQFYGVSAMFNFAMDESMTEATSNPEDDEEEYLEIEEDE